MKIEHTYNNWDRISDVQRMYLHSFLKENGSPEDIPTYIRHFLSPHVSLGEIQQLLFTIKDKQMHPETTQRSETQKMYQKLKTFILSKQQDLIARNAVVQLQGSILNDDTNPNFFINVYTLHEDPELRAKVMNEWTDEIDDMGSDLRGGISYISAELVKRDLDLIRQHGKYIVKDPEFVNNLDTQMSGMADILYGVTLYASNQNALDTLQNETAQLATENPLFGATVVNVLQHEASR